MTLFVSDLHYEPGVPEARAAERELAKCLAALAPMPDRVVLAGDLFDAFVEYRSLVPHPPVRLFGLLARWADDGIPVHYLVGNHDPWHRSWARDELGFEINSGVLRLRVDDKRIHVEHGDRIAGASLLRRVVRHPWALSAYTALLPADTGQRLAAAVSRAARRRRMDPTVGRAMERRAASLIQSGEADLVVFGHTHEPRLLEIPPGCYVNCGSWRDQRTVAVLERGELRLRRWNGQRLAEWLPG